MQDRAVTKLGTKENDSREILQRKDVTCKEYGTKRTEMFKTNDYLQGSYSA